MPFFLIDGYDVLGAPQTEISDTMTAELEETHGLGDSWKEQLYVGLKSGELTQDGFFDDAAAGANAALSTGPGVSRVLCYGLGGTATGAGFVGFAGAMQVNYQKTAERGKLQKAKASYKSNGVIDHGQILWTHKSMAGSATNSGVLDAGGSATGLVAYFQLTDFTSAANATNLVVKIQESASGGSSWQDLLTFTASAAPFAQRQTTTGMVQQFIRTNATYGGGASLAASRYFVGIKRGNTTI